MGLWLELGLDGFRLDAVPFFLETRGQLKDEAANLDPHKYLSALRSFLSRRNGSAVLLGEVNLPYKEQLEYFGGPEGNELNMQFDFMTMQHLYLSLARQDARPLAETLKSHPPLHPDNQWAIFVRNHDELTLDKLSDGERQEVFAAFGPEKNMQIYGRGLRRRLPPMLDGDADRTSSTARRSAWARTCGKRAGLPSARPCNGPARRTVAFPGPRLPNLWRRWYAVNLARKT